MIAKVCIDRNSSQLAESYDYLVPDALLDQVEIGCCVLVPFGFDEVKGYVLDLVNESTNSLTKKEIIDVLNSAADFGPGAFSLALNLANEINCQFSSIYSMMLPSFVKGNKKTFLHILNYEAMDANLAILLNGRTKIEYNNDLKDYKSLIDKEIAKGNIKKGYEYIYYGQNKFKKVYSVLKNELQSTNIRNIVIKYLSLHPESTLDDIRVATNASSSIVKALVLNGSVKEEEKKIEREDKTLEKKLNKNISFSFEEQSKYDFFNNSSLQTPTLFFTNDENFRLNFYLKLIDDARRENKKVVIILPSILKGEELLIKLKRYLKNYKVILYHSLNKVSDNYDYYEDIKEANYDCLLAVLGSCFLPFTNVSTIVMEDCDDLAYISDTYPYINVKEVLLKKHKLLNARLLLSTSSSSIIDYYKAQNSQYNLIEKHIGCDCVYRVVDMREEIIEENNTIISSTLKNVIDQTLQLGKVSALICNNLSFSTQIRCRSCGKVLKCPKCKLPLTYSKKNNTVRCNYCGFKQESFDKCSCGEKNFISFGFGIEQVLEKVKCLYPDKIVLEVSSLTLNRSDSTNELIQKIEEGEVDIIVGTNAMLSILNLANIDTVSFLYMDSFLNASNFLGSEITYNMISKASIVKNVVIQTYNKDSDAICMAIKNDWNGFYKQELENREMLYYPPFSNMSKVVIKGDYNEIFHFGFYLKKALSSANDVECLGPTYDYKAQGVSLIIKYKEYEKVFKAYTDTAHHFEKEKITSSIQRFTKGG